MWENTEGKLFMNLISLLNGIAVAVFGMILSASFCDIDWNRKKRMLMTGSMAGLLLIQGIIFYFMDSGMVRHLYPMITHLPLMLILYLFTKQRLWALGSVLTAYLCCQVRRWLALFVTAVMGGDAAMQGIAELIITLPLLLFLLKNTMELIRIK